MRVLGRKKNKEEGVGGVKWLMVCASKPPHGPEIRSFQVLALGGGSHPWRKNHLAKEAEDLAIKFR